MTKKCLCPLGWDDEIYTEGNIEKQIDCVKSLCYFTCLKCLGPNINQCIKCVDDTRTLKNSKCICK